MQATHGYRKNRKVMKPESPLETSTPVGIVNPEKDLGVKSDSPLTISLPGSVVMNFIIEDFNFTLTVDGNDHLTGLTATRDNTTWDCTIQLVSQADGERQCCGPTGDCKPGSC
jgi:hypothetical protein